MQRKFPVKTTHLFAAASMFALLGCSGDPFWGAGAPPEDAHADHAKADSPQVNHYFRAEEKVTEGTVEVEGNTIDYRAIAGTIIVHPHGWDDAAAKPDGDAKDAAGGSVDVVRRLFQRGRKRAHAADHLRLQWRPGFLDRVAAYGRVRAAPRRDAGRHAHAGAPYQLVDNEYSLLDVERPRLHRCARHRLQPHRRQGQGEGLLRRRRRRPCLRRLHHAVPDQVRPLEFAQISVRRKLRHAALGGAGQSAGDARTMPTSTA